ncbi:MAG TPA: hypothetical protein VLQ48_10220 [Chloroflexia bacterium]|nr:hypothetical protein [Chloroflexia bacterium]
MKNYNVYKSTRASWLNAHRIREVLFLLGVAIVLGFGLALAAPAHGATLWQAADGDISGTITVAGGNAAGITVELRQHDNSKGVTSLASTTTDENGVYHFLNQASTPGTAYYEIDVTGGPGMLAVWYSFPIIYLSGQNFTVPSIEMSDVSLLYPQAGANLTLPDKLTWKARRAGETFRVSVYEAGKLDKSVLDSGSLGMNITYNILDGSLAPGTYEAVIMVRDAVVGYGVSQQHFQFTVGSGDSTVGQPTPGVSNGTPVAPTEAPTAAPPQAQGQPALALHLTADQTELGAGGAIVYKLEVTNTGNAVAPGVVVTDQLPAGITVDPTLVSSSVGQATVSGSSITVQIGDLNPNDTVVVTIPATLSDGSLPNISNQASALYTGVTDAIMSNAYVAQVAQATGPTETPQEEATSEPAATTPPDPATEVPTEVVEPPTVAPEPPADTPVPVAPVAADSPTPEAIAQAPTVVSDPTLAPVAPTPRPNPTQATKSTGGGGGTSQTPSAPIPQTGGSFPIMFAILLLAATLAARYLRGYLRSRNGRRT